jgi:hypothetical protein
MLDFPDFTPSTHFCPDFARGMYNWQFRFHSRDMESESCLLRREPAELHVFLQFRVAISAALVTVTDPEAQQVIRHSLLAKMRHTVSPKGVEAALYGCDFPLP